MQRSIDDALKIDTLNENEKDAIANARTNFSLVEVPTSVCGFLLRPFQKKCYDIDDYEAKLLNLADVDDLVRLVVARRRIHEKIDSAILTTQEVDPGIFGPQLVLISPNNKYFAVVEEEANHVRCNFVIYKGQ